MLAPLTALQFATFEELYPARERSGRELRYALAKNHNVKRSAPAFYQMMSRLEEGGLVKGWYVEKVIDGQRIKERRYRLEGKGVTAWEQTRDFYSRASLGAGHAAGGA